MLTNEKPSKPSPTKQPKRGKVQKIRKQKCPLQLIDKDEPTQPEAEPEPEHQGEGDEYDVERAIQMSLESFQAPGQAYVGGVVAILENMRTLATEEASTGPSVQPQNNTSTNIVCDSPSPADAKTGADTDKTNNGGDTKILQIGEEQGDDVANVVNLEEKTSIFPFIANCFITGSYKDGNIDGDTLFQQCQVHNCMLILDQHLCRNHESSSKDFNASVNSDINFFLSMSK
ncbi:hypothetical protein Tco_0058700 [Tanacetum coccineum]